MRSEYEWLGVLAGSRGTRTRRKELDERVTFYRSKETERKETATKRKNEESERVRSFGR